VSHGIAGRRRGGWGSRVAALATMQWLESR